MNKLLGKTVIGAVKLAEIPGIENCPDIFILFADFTENLPCSVLGFVDADKIGGQKLLQLPEPLLDAVVISVRIDGDHLSVQDGDALDLGKGQPAQLVLPAAHQAVRARIAAYQILDLPCQLGGSMHPRNAPYDKHVISERPAT